MTMQNIQKPPKLISLFKLIRLDKPTGVLVLWWPTAWALWVSSDGTISFLWILFFLGSFFMRSAGCIWNDISDADIDKYVKRTANRPIASGNISKKEALFFLIILLFLAALIAWQLPKAAFQLCLVALMLTGFYPLTKRFFKAPQLFLGLAFSMAVPIAFAANDKQTTSAICLTLYLSAVTWPLIYDTIYALSDKKDDAFLNIHSLPLTLDSNTFLFVDLCQLLFVLLLCYAGYLAEASLIYFVLMASYTLVALHQHITLRSTTNYQKIFRAYQWLGALIMAGFILGI